MKTIYKTHTKRERRKIFRALRRGYVCEGYQTPDTWMGPGEFECGYYGEVSCMECIFFQYQGYRGHLDPRIEI